MMQRNILGINLNKTLISLIFLIDFSHLPRIALKCMPRRVQTSRKDSRALLIPLPIDSIILLIPGLRILLNLELTIQHSSRNETKYFTQTYYRMNKVSLQYN